MAGTSVTLTGNFLATCRALTFSNAGGLSWTFDQNTNVLTATPTSGVGVFLSSVGLVDSSTSPIYTVGNSPLLANGTLTLTLQAQNANYGFYGPASGAAAQPGFRAQVIADLPTGIPNANLANSAVTVTAGTGLSGGGSVSLGSSVTISLSSPVSGANGGTGVSNSGKTITLGGNVTTSGAFNLTLTLTASTSVTLPTSGTLATTSQIPTSANPSGSVGLSAVNGSTGNWMDAGSAPALSQSIAPTWTGQHAWGVLFTPTVSGTPILIKSSGHTYIELVDSSTNNAGIVLGNNGNQNQANIVYVYNGGTPFLQIATAASNASIQLLTQSATRVTVNASGTVSFTSAIGVNGATPPSQSTGWGTPTGASVENDFAGGSATLAVCTAAVAEIITVLKAVGILGA